MIKIGKAMFIILLILPSIVACSNEYTPEEIAQKVKESSVCIEGLFVEKDLIFDDTTEWTGTGVIIDRKGRNYTILTNLHVIGFWEIYYADISDPELKKYQIKIKTFNNEIAKIKNIKINEKLKDLALIEVELKNNYGIMEFEEKEMVMGEQVYAMGNPFGLNYSFTSGVVSGKRMFVSDLGAEYKFIQTDTSINPGNSGGALVNKANKIVGLNTLKHRDGDIGFAIASAEISKSIISEEFVSFPYENPSKVGDFVTKLKMQKIAYKE